MFSTYRVLAAFGAVVFATACAAPLPEGEVVSRGVEKFSLAKFRKAAPAASGVLPISWKVLASPVTIAAEDPAKIEASASQIGGHAVLQAVAHTVPDSYQITWSGRRDTDAEKPTRLTLRDAAGNRAVEFQFAGDRLRVLNAKDDIFPDLTFSTETAHKVVIELKMTAEPTVTIDIRQGKTPLYTTPPIAVLDAGFSSLDAFEVEVSSKDTAYHLADFEVRQTNG